MALYLCGHKGLRDSPGRHRLTGDRGQKYQEMFIKQDLNFLCIYFCTSVPLLTLFLFVNTVASILRN